MAKQYVIAEMHNGKHQYVRWYDNVTLIGVSWVYSLSKAARFGESEKEAALSCVRKICDSKSPRLIPVSQEKVESFPPIHPLNMTDEEWSDRYWRSQP